MNDKKKLAAAVAGVMTYIKQEEEAQMVAALNLGMKPNDKPNLWGLHGRQSIMHMRGQIQMRAFQKS